MPKATQQSMQEAFLKSYEEFADSIYRFCLFKVSHAETARDLTQDVFLRAWDYVAEGKKIDSFKALFYRIASNLVIDYYRKKKGSSLDDLIEAGFDPTAGDQTERLGDQIDGLQVLKVMDKLEPQYRDVVLLRYIEDMAVKDIAKLYGEKENTISVKIYRGLNQIRELLNHEE